MPLRSDPARKLIAGLATLCLGGLALLANAGQFAMQGRAIADVPAGPIALGQLRTAPLGASAPFDRVRVAVIASPLASDPFLAKGFIQEPDGSAHFALPLLQEAVRRDPHRPRPRMALMAEAAARNDPGGVVLHLSALQRIDPALGDRFAARLGASIDNEEHARLLAHMLIGHPDVFTAVLEGMAQADRPAILGATMVRDFPSAALAKPTLHTAAISALVRNRDYASARRLAWPDDMALLHSPDFRDLSAPTPFGWSLNAIAAGSADPDPAGGLTLSAYGRADGVLASQMMALAPGHWQLLLNWQPGGGSPGVLAMRMRCADNGQTLARANLPSAGATRSIALQVDLPQDGQCGGQFLELIADVSTPGSSAQGRAIRIDVTRGGT